MIADVVTVYTQPDDAAIANIFPDINPRSLRIAEVRSWYCAWMETDDEPDADDSVAAELGPFTPPPLSQKTLQDDADALDNALLQLATEFALEDKRAGPTVGSPPTSGTATTATMTPPLSLSSVPPSSAARRPLLRLKLEDMPTSQQAEDRAQRAASRLIAKREAIEQAMEAASASAAASGAAKPSSSGVSATQSALLRLNFKSYSSGDESDLQSPSGACRVVSRRLPQETTS